ncbi:MAG: methylase [Micrococcales bacterium 73-13]|nr:MAG: methylase [Micrococcales bacterium 73-13]
MSAGRGRGPVGRITRGTTGTNRLRRFDRWIAALPILRRSPDPLVVDLGYGASATTALELHHRLSRVRPDVEVVGVEIDPERVASADRSLRERREPGGAAPRVSFRLGGFEAPTPDGRPPAIIRAANVLRQYDEAEVGDAWTRLLGRLQPGGALVEGTCSENGRVGAWITLSPERGAETLTIGLHLPSLEAPSIVAERLPKALIHRNVPGEPIHDLVADLDRAWASAAPLSVYGPVQRWIATAEAIAERWPVTGGRARWRLGELAVAWEAVRPRS